jgi:hypothetical protein
MKYKWYFMPQFVVQCAAYEKLVKFDSSVLCIGISLN